MMTRSLTIIYATSSGHTEYVVDMLINHLTKLSPHLKINKQRAERTTEQDIQKSECLILACGTWNTGNAEGQLNPFMHAFIHERVQHIDLKGKVAAAIGLGDERYIYTAKSAELLTNFLKDHHASVLIPALKIVNEPFEQEAKIELWTEEFLRAFEKLPIKQS